MFDLQTYIKTYLARQKFPIGENINMPIQPTTNITTHLNLAIQSLHSNKKSIH